MPLTLCVFLWARNGDAAGLARYENRVLALLARHDAKLLHRVRSDGSDDHPDEVQLFQFPSDAEFDGYMSDPARVAMAAERDAVIKRTEIMRVDVV